MTDILEEAKDVLDECGDDVGNAEWWFGSVRDCMDKLISEVERLRKELIMTPLNQPNDEHKLREEIRDITKELEEVKEGYLGESTDNKYQCSCGLILFGHKMRMICKSRDETLEAVKKERDELKGEVYTAIFRKDKLEAENAELREKVNWLRKRLKDAEIKAGKVIKPL